MGNFKPRNGNFGNRSGGFGGRREGGFGGNRGFDNDRGSGFGRGRDSDRPMMHEATCSKCGKSCQVPFRPTGSKPVFCSDCFRQTDQGSGRDRGFAPRSSAPSQASGMTSEQFSKLNAKLDKILEMLETLEIVEEGAEDEDSEDEEDLKED